MNTVLVDTNGDRESRVFKQISSCTLACSKLQENIRWACALITLLKQCLVKNYRVKTILPDRDILIVFVAPNVLRITSNERI